MKHHEGSNPLTMAYDAGNRITTSVLGSSQFTTFTHDANGNLTSERCDYLSVLSTFVYDSENRCLNELRSSGANHTYTYAPDGLRRSMHQGGAASPVSFIWDGDDLLNDYIGGGVSVRYDVLDGEVFGHKGGANRYLYVPDPLGSVVNLLDTSQTIAGTYVYAPYGEVLSHTGANTAMQFVGALGYQTQIANRTYIRARYYRPDLGRWVTRDSIRHAGRKPAGYTFGLSRDAARATGGWRAAVGTGGSRRTAPPRDPDRKCGKGCGEHRETVRRWVADYCSTMASQEGRRCVYECLADVGHVYGSAAHRVANCLRRWCGSRQWNCTPCEGGSPHACAQAIAEGVDYDLCEVEICYRTFEPGSACAEFVLSSGIPDFIFHEVAHCCNFRGWSEEVVRELGECMRRCPST